MSSIIENDDGSEQQDGGSQEQEKEPWIDTEVALASPSQVPKVRRRGSPAAPLPPVSSQRRGDKENQAPRLWKDGSAHENVPPRRHLPPDLRRVSFDATTPVHPRRAAMGTNDTTPSTGSTFSHTQQQWIYDNQGDEIEIVKLPSQVALDGNSNGEPSTASPQRTNKPSAMKSTSSLSPGDSRPVMSRTNAQMELLTSDKIYQPPTHLHDVCYRAKHVDDLMDFLQSPNVRGRDLSSSAVRKDKKGRIPMHIFSENHALAGSIFTPLDPDDDFQVLQQLSSFGRDQSNDKKLTKFLLEALLSTNPTGVTWKDNEGFMPFERSLVQWTRSIYSAKQTRSNRTLSSASRRKSVTADTLHSMWASTTMTVTSAMSWAGRSLHFQTNLPDDEASDMECGTLAEASVIDPRAPTTFPTAPVRLTSLARCSFKVLSIIVDQLEEHIAKNSNRSLRNVAQRQESLQSDSFDAALDSFRSFCKADSAVDVARRLVEQIAKVPNLVLTIFLLDDESDKEWVLNSTLFKRIAVHHASVDPWINAMMQNSDKSVARRGLEYLRYVSDAVATSKGIDDDFLESISQLEGFIPSLLALEERQIEEAATTFIVRSVLDKMISRPFAATVVFCDFFFLCGLMVGFRFSVNSFLLGESFETVLRWIYVANTGIFYFVIRELGKCITILERTRHASIYLWSIWNIADILSTVFALTSTILIRVNFSDTIDYGNINPLRAFLSVTTGCLWMRALSLLKSLNIQLATFVLAILQICKDILWFLIILGALVACFAQMFFTLLLPSSCATDEAYRESNLQCSQSEYYLSLYTILGNLGGFQEFSRDTFTTGFSIFLLVFFSFMVVIILLNVLIAIVSDSYEKCLVRSHCLFGRARVLLIAELVSFQNLLRIQQSSVQQVETEHSTWCLRHLWNRGWSQGSIAFFCRSVFVLVVWLIGEIAGSFCGKRYGNLLYSFFSIFVNVLLFAAIMVFLSRGAAESPDVEEGERPTNSRWYDYFQIAMFRLLGTSKEMPKFTRKAETDEWKGRLNYLQEEMERIAEKSNGRMENQIKYMHAAMSEPNSFEAELVNLRADVMSELREMERRNMLSMQQILEALGSRQALAVRPGIPPRPSSRPN
jgi:hypothetical protein